jgi:simple sugar transport system permease protein
MQGIDRATERQPSGQSVARLFHKVSTIRELGPAALLILLCGAFYYIGPAFLSTMNISNMLSYVPELGIMALGMTLLLTAGEIDLSVGSLFGFCPVLLFVLYNQHVMSFEAAFAVSLVASALIGLANGLLVTKVRISSFITTIGMMLIVRGGALYITNGFPQATWKSESWIKSLMIGTVFESGDFTLSASLIWFVALAVVLHIVLKDMRFGNWILATGGNVRAAKARGVDTDRVKVILFVVCALLAGFAGAMDALRIESAYPISGTGYEMEIIAMVVIGGTLLYGGRGTILGTVIGVFLLRSIRNGIIVVGVPGLAYNIFVGLIIVIMMAVHSLIEQAQTGES